MEEYNGSPGTCQAPTKPIVHGRSSKGLRVDLELAKELLIQAGFQLYPPRSRYELWRAYIGDANAVAYHSGKIIAQGRYPEKVLQTIAPALLPEEGQNYGSHNNSLF
jgi:ribonuclease HIII